MKAADSQLEIIQVLGLGALFGIRSQGEILTKGMLSDLYKFQDNEILNKYKFIVWADQRSLNTLSLKFISTKFMKI